MPNHCENRVVFYADTEERLEQVRKRLKGYVPGYMNRETGMRDADDESLFNFHDILPVPDWVLNEGYSEAGYDWQSTNWSVKWGAYYIEENDVQEEEEGFSLTYTFSTAWRDPEGIIMHLPKIFPDVSFEWSYSETGMIFFGFHVYDAESQLMQDFYYDTSTTHADINEVLDAMRKDEAPEDLILTAEYILEMFDEAMEEE